MQFKIIGFLHIGFLQEYMCIPVIKVDPSPTCVQFKIIDFGIATFNEQLAQAAGGYEYEASGRAGLGFWHARSCMHCGRSWLHR
jgi:hypothetical protein